ncbi:MAG: hypothetical protein NC314_00650 [Roseburia sp.]|nr:hypothetical protein [Ruminococcus sp.]MCM1154196.1 hypothetical protein [Roseburia sp.]MCM1241322.1 hypothetical protein [Roseburia sp.]
MKKTYAQRNYKDTLFRMLFREKENLLNLYNALNQTAYTDVKDLEITTLENAVYMNYKNDISFVFDFELMLYEHQSTVNPNMPLRDLFYVAKVLQRRVKDSNLYGTRLVTIPTPRFVIFYNGTDSRPERQVLRLSDAFEKTVKYPGLELIVTVYNINWGHNKELLDACRILKEYAQYVEQVRIFAKDSPFSEAVENAVDYCIQNGILSEFLSSNRAEAIEVSIFEYNEEQHLKSEREQAYQEGQELGRKEGEKRLGELMSSLLKAGKKEEMERILTDEEYRNRLYLENGL